MERWRKLMYNGVKEYIHEEKWIKKGGSGWLRRIDK